MLVKRGITGGVQVMTVTLKALINGNSVLGHPTCLTV